LLRHAASAQTADPRSEFVEEVVAIFKDGDSWKLNKNGGRYMLRLLAHHLNRTFALGNAQTTDSLGEQGMKAVLEAVSATGYGRLLAVLRPWAINMSHMEWTGPAAKLSTVQLTLLFPHCAPVVLNLRAQRQDGSRHKTGAPARGIALLLDDVPPPRARQRAQIRRRRDQLQLPLLQPWHWREAHLLLCLWRERVSSISWPVC